MFARYVGPQYTLGAVNVGGVEQTVPFWFPVGGNYTEELEGGDQSLHTRDGNTITSLGEDRKISPPTTFRRYASGAIALKI